MSSPQNRHRLSSVAAMGVAAALVLSACGEGGSSSGGAASGACEIPDVVKLVGTRDKTGPLAATGLAAVEGTELAVKEINAKGFLGEGVTLDVTEKDTAFDPQVAAQEVTSAAGNSDVRAILGPLVSSQALAAAPIAQQAGVPIVFTQAGISGLLLGDMTFRATAPLETIFHHVTDNMLEEGVSSISLLSLSSVPTYKEVATKVVPELLKDTDVKTLSGTEVEASVTDFQAPVTKIAEENPDAVVMMLLGTQVVTAVKQLRQTGYDGRIYINSAVTAEQLKSLGDAGVGLRYATDFSSAMTDDGAVAFTRAFEKEFGKLPDLISAESYDQTWWVARAIKEADCADRSAIAEGLTKVGNAGFEGAMGDLKFKNGNDLRVEGTLVEWNGASEELVAP